MTGVTPAGAAFIAKVVLLFFLVTQFLFASCLQNVGFACNKIFWQAALKVLCAAFWKSFPQRVFHVQRAEWDLGCVLKSHAMGDTVTLPELPVTLPTPQRFCHCSQSVSTFTVGTVLGWFLLAPDPLRSALCVELVPHFRHVKEHKTSAHMDQCYLTWSSLLAVSCNYMQNTTVKKKNRDRLSVVKKYCCNAFERQTLMF